MSQIHMKMDRNAQNRPNMNPNSQSGSNGSPPSGAQTLSSNLSRVNGNNGDKKQKPAVAIFWDIENCRIPRGFQAIDVAAKLKEELIEKHGRIYDSIVCCCDLTKQSQFHPNLSMQLNQANIDAYDVPSGAKNGADFKLIQLMSRWVSSRPEGDVLVLISGDQNFSQSLNQYRYNNLLRIILLHPFQVSQCLTVLANETYRWEDFVNGISPSGIRPQQWSERDEDRKVIIKGFAATRSYEQIQNRLRNLCGSYGGSVVLNMSGQDPAAVATCSSTAYARRLRQGVHGADCYGYQLVTFYYPGSSLWHEEQEYYGVPNNAQYSPAGSLLHSSSSAPDQLQRMSFQPNGRRPRFGQPPFIPWMHPNLPGTSIQFEAPILVNDGGGVNVKVEPTATVHTRGTSNGTRKPIEFNLEAADRKLVIPKMKAKVKLVPVMPEAKKEKQQLSAVQRFILQAQERRLAAELAGLNFLDNTKTLEEAVVLEKKVDIKESRIKGSLSEPNKVGKRVIVPVASLVDVDDGTDTDVYVINLDAKVDRDDLLVRLVNVLESAVPIKSMSIHEDQLGLVFAHIIVSNMAAARQLIDYVENTIFEKRMLSASLDDPNLPVPSVVQQSIVEIFKKHKNEELAHMDLCRYFEIEHDVLLEWRTILKMSSILDITEHSGKRWIRIRPAGLAMLADKGNEEKPATLAKGYCEQHCTGLDIHKIFPRKQYTPTSLYRVPFGLAIFKDQVVDMLKKHGSIMPINSFLICFDAFYPKGLVEDISDGVHLEHLLLCVPGVSIEQKPLEPRKLMYQEVGIVNGEFWNAGNELSEVVVDVLALTERAAFPVGTFLDRYHAYIGQQHDTRFIDHSVLLRELQAVSKDVEVLGVGAERIVTLTHEAQQRRFKADLAKMSEKYRSTPITIDNFAERYRTVHGFGFVAKNYGVCHLEDLFNGTEIPYLDPEFLEHKSKGRVVVDMGTANKIVVSGAALQTLRVEVVALLNASPKYRVNLLRFPGTYQQLYNKQLVLVAYGCTKLVQLVTLMPDVMEVVNVGKDRFIQLALDLRRQDFQQFGQFLAERKQEYSLPEIRQIFTETYRTGNKLAFDDYGCSNWEELLFNFSDIFQVIQGSSPLTVRLKPPSTPSSIDAQPIAPDSPPASTSDVKLSKKQRKRQKKQKLAAATANSIPPDQRNVENDAPEENPEPPEVIPVRPISTRLAMTFA